MLDFLRISTRPGKSKGTIEIYPKFYIMKSSDLMIRGGDFYAIWIEDKGLWSTDEQDAIELIDQELDKYAKENESRLDGHVQILHVQDAETRMIDKWHRFCQKDMRDSFHMLDEKLIFSNSPTNKKDYSSKRLPYPLEEGSIDGYETLMNVLYAPEERRKIEWAIGSIVSGDSRKIQKFMVLYGAAGTGKSTVLNIIQQLFEGYYSVFDAKALGSSSNTFALEAFKTNPLVAIQHDGDLSRIEDNTRLNSLVSHEYMTVNEKFKSTYSNRFKCFLFLGTNRPVRITDGKSGLIRRLIDVSPTGDKVSRKEYNVLTEKIKFELGHIANHCLKVYEESPGYYDDYVPTTMMGASNDFYNFVEDSYFVFKNDDGTSLKSAWERYKVYCEEAKVGYTSSMRVFKEELKNYFREYIERYVLEDGTRIRNYYKGFIFDKFDKNLNEDKDESVEKIEFIDFKVQPSILDKECAECMAQYATDDETPNFKWANVRTKLKDLDTSKLHYLKFEDNTHHIVIDFDIRGKDGSKNFEENLKEASKWPKTYAELSKSGAGIHLHYIYKGDPSKLSRIYDDNIEIKVFKGNSSLRRKLTKCNDIPIATIASGLPLKGDKKVIDYDSVLNERAIRTIIKRNLNKEYHPATKPSIDFIYSTLENAYNNGSKYDVSDMRSAIFAFAANSTNQSDYCMKLVPKMHFKSDTPSENKEFGSDRLAFYDVEVFPNLLLVVWKFDGAGDKRTILYNPDSAQIEQLLQLKLVGFNCRRYDNHILYARLMGYTNEQIYKLSKKIVSGEHNAGMFGEAYNLSYTDIYDFASASNKMSLKKLEIKMGIHHQELGMDWDQPVPEDKWPLVAEYCCNDVDATEAAFHYLNADWTAREILADIAGMTVNDTTNSLTTKIIFGNNKHPQDQFNYRNLAEDDIPIKPGSYVIFNSKGQPVFPGYKFERGVSTYRGEEVGEGGYVYAEPGIYTNVALLDIASMHPSSIIAENLFGDEYTKRFAELKQARVLIKHKDFEQARKIMNGALAKFLTSEEIADILSNVLKTPINSVYGLTSAKFDNPFRDKRNIDNIVAKRGALFMINLKHEVQERGFTVAHIKTDSIKIPNATPEIIQFVKDFGKMYGYEFEHEATYAKMCLVNNAVYIAKYNEQGIINKGGKHANEWTATGTQFAVPYVFKKLFSKEKIEFEDMCETKQVTTNMYLDMNEETPDEHHLIFVGKVGLYCPIKPGCGGGNLVREALDKNGNIKYDTVVGTKGYRWLESEMVKQLHKEDDIDRSYYDALVNAAVDAISAYGDFELFTND